MRLAKMLMARAPTSRIELDVPRKFVEFCLWLGVALTPGQAELCRVLYDGDLPVDRGLAKRIFGDIEFDNLPVGIRSLVAICAGARSGKTFICIALRLLHSMLVCDLRSLAPGQRAVALNIAPNDKLRREALNYARGAVKMKAELESLVDGEGADGFGLRRPDGHLVRFETGVATAGGYAARGRSLVAFACDEVSFFRSEGSVVNDAEIVRAGAARVLPGGQTIVASTPWAKTGTLWELYKENWGHPKTALVAHTPTLVMHDSDLTRALVARETERDPENAQREFEALFMSDGTTVFFSEDLIESCIDHSIALQQEVPGDASNVPGLTTNV